MSLILVIKYWCKYNFLTLRISIFLLHNAALRNRISQKKVWLHLRLKPETKLKGVGNTHEHLLRPLVRTP